MQDLLKTSQGALDQWGLSLYVAETVRGEGLKAFDLERVMLEQMPREGKAHQYAVFKSDVAKMFVVNRPAGMHYVSLEIAVYPAGNRGTRGRVTTCAMVLPIFPSTVEDVLRAPPPQREWINIIRRAAGKPEEMWTYMAAEVQGDRGAKPALTFLCGGERGTDGDMAEATRLMQANGISSSK